MQLRRLSMGLTLLMAPIAALTPGLALAHGSGKPSPTVNNLLTAWEPDWLLGATLLITAWAYASAVRSVNRAHPGAPFPRRRVAFFAAGVAVLVLATMSPIAAYDGELLTVHMWQHMLITLVAAPLLLLGTPVTLALRAASSRTRKNVLLPVLHGRLVKALTFPVFAWLALAGTMWISHFSPFYNASLENEWLHRLEHAWYVAAALLFWWPAIGLDPTAWRMNHPIRMLYIFLQMPQNSFLGLAFYSSGHVLYNHYASSERTWGPSPLSDQQFAGGLMWVVGDLFFLIALVCLAVSWIRHEERRTKVLDAALERERRARAASLEAL
jgi:putative copper resistance protein D